jgi:hypothetical protein
LIGRIVDTSNYVTSTSNILVGRINDTSNYVGTVTNYWTEQNTNNIYLNKTGNVGIGTNTPQTKLHIYNATESTIRLETGTSGKPSIEFSVGTLTDTITDFRIINDNYELKFQYQDNLVSYGGVGSDIMSINDKGTMYNKPIYYVDGIGVKTSPDPLYSLDVSGDVRFYGGNVGIGTEPTTGPTGQYRLNVAGDINIEGIGNKYYVNNLPVISSQWATDATRIYYNGGNVGIGTTNPQTKLHIYNATESTIRLETGTSGKPSIEFSVGTLTDTFTDYRMINDAYELKFQYQDDLVSYGATGSDIFAITDKRTTYNKPSYYIEGIGVKTFPDPLYSLDVSGDCRITGSLGIGAGSLGIGVDTIGDGFLLEVGQGSGTTGASIGARYFASGNATLAFYTGYFNQLSVKVTGSIWITSTYLTSSDSRIKEDIQDINDDNALNMILAIEPKTYTYIDKVVKGESKVYGFIAQQIREVIPEAISIQKSYIPNIMLLADYDSNIITLPSPTTKVIIKQNDKIKCYDKDNKDINVEVEEVIDELTFRIKPLEIPYTDNKIFVYGTEIDDFHTLNKDYIFTLNVCATQELHRRIISQEERIKELETKMTQILNNISQ